MTTSVIDDRRATYILLRQLRAVEEAQADADAWLEAAQADHAEGTAQREAAKADLHRQIEQIAADLRTPGSEHVDVPGIGRIQFRTTKPGLRVADAAEALKWVEEHEYDAFIRIVPEKRELDVSEFRKFAASVLASDADLLPGVEETPEHTSMSIQWRA